jgi:hypothetical protein
VHKELISWNETIIQLWKSPEIHKTEHMPVSKALGISEKGCEMKSYDLSELKFEYTIPFIPHNYLSMILKLKTTNSFSN